MVADHSIEGSRRRARRAGRGMLSSIDMLPACCRDDVMWTNAELRHRRLTQTEILQQLNTRLAAKGIKAISKGAFSRHSVRLAIETRKIEEAATLLANCIEEAN
jgi:hypothetical protein